MHIYVYVYIYIYTDIHTYVTISYDCCSSSACKGLGRPTRREASGQGLSSRPGVRLHRSRRSNQRMYSILCYIAYYARLLHVIF